MTRWCNVYASSTGRVWLGAGNRSRMHADVVATLFTVARRLYVLRVTLKAKRPEIYK